MRLLWISKLHANESSTGDAVFDRKLEAALREHSDVVAIGLRRRRLGRAGRAWSMLAGRPYDRQEFDFRANQEALSRVDPQQFDAMIVSHEALDWAVDLVPLPTVLIYHNVSSRIMEQVIRFRAVQFLAHHLYRKYEANLLRRIDGRTRVVTLSSKDAAAIEPHLSNAVTVILPGAPDAENPVLQGASPVLHAVGSQEWAPKRRDMASFISSWHRRPRTVHLNAASGFRGAEGFPQPVAFGLVADRFDAGFKLKIGEYIAHGIVPIALVDVYADMRHLPFADEFLLVATDADEVERQVVSTATAWDESTSSRFLEFRAAAMASMTWEGAAAGVINAVLELVEQT